MRRLQFIVAASALSTMFTVLIVMGRVMNVPLELSAQVAFMSGCTVYTGLSAIVLAIWEVAKKIQ